MMRLLLLSVIVFSTPSVALTYYVDSTCNAYPNVGRAIPEALLMARRSDERLGANDADIQAAFQRIFNTDTSDVESVNKVRGIMSSISQLEASTDFNSADVRIYCDDDARWTLRADRKEKDGSLSANPDSSRTPDEQIWIDKVNGRLSKGLPNCKANFMAVVFHSTISGPEYSSQNPERKTMTLCKPYIQQKIANIEEMGRMGSSEFTRVRMAKDDGIGYLLSVVVLHEFTHVFGTDDVQENGGPYGWRYTIAKKTADAIENADNYAFFGLLSLLGDKHFKLSTDEQEAIDGVLVRTTATYPK